jgi:hypothetical protein
MREGFYLSGSWARSGESPLFGPGICLRLATPAGPPTCGSVSGHQGLLWSSPAGHPAEHFYQTPCASVAQRRVQVPGQPFALEAAEKVLGRRDVTAVSLATHRAIPCCSISFR